jgi:hypothetical protein
MTQANAWQPIETAPKDGTEILAWREDCGVFLARYGCMYDFLTESEMSEYEDETCSQKDWWSADFITGCRLDLSEDPTHWQPVPSGPTKS